MSKKSIKVLRVASQREGFRRAGHVFGRVPTDIPLDQLTAAARKAIEGDQSLVAIETEIEVDAAEDAAAGDGGADPKAPAGKQTTPPAGKTGKK
ncbi:MAG: hypothetical protein WA924_07480 [Burkholderiaceae bacterium]